jgi:hypothetical protein
VQSYTTIRQGIHQRGKTFEWANLEHIREDIRRERRQEELSRLADRERDIVSGWAVSPSENPVYL